MIPTNVKMAPLGSFPFSLPSRKRAATAIQTIAELGRCLVLRSYVAGSHFFSLVTRQTPETLNPEAAAPFRRNLED